MSGTPPPPRAVVVGCSAGGLAALQQLLGGLARPLPAPMVVVCHSGSEDMRLFCELLAARSGLPVGEAEERCVPQPGHVYVAPSGYHLLFERDRRFALSVDPRVAFSRPSVDVLFESAAEAWHDRLLAVLLTGANADGAQGCRRIRAAGGRVIVEDPRTAQAPAMPAATLELAGADHCLPLADIPALLESLCP
ncbi:chemotaxis protein CheB [Stenotrophomonas mori]|uniref:protein-glutamate methylesterase n=1 Tax=Stenotrophomonas mori TaxID=2871096 RepID=A0ABT0SHH6_9GAMM|nr:chemotaxis protein CheB [Stenotrophomonas mori]